MPEEELSTGEELEEQVDQDPDAPTEPRMVIRRFNGDDYEMPEHLARVWDERNTTFERRLDEQARRIRSEIQAQPQPPRQEPHTQQNWTDEDAEWYGSPSQVWARKEAQLRQEFDQRLYLEEQRRAFWSDFWTEHSDLRGKELIVRAVFNESLPAMRDMTPEEGRRYTAEKVREMIGDSRPQTSRRPLSDKQVTSEPSRPPGPARRTQPPEEGPTTLAATIRAVQESKRRASHFDLTRNK